MTDEEYKAIRLAVARGVDGVAEAHALLMGPLDRLRAELARVSETACGYLEDLQTVSRERDDAIQYRTGMLDMVRTANEQRDLARSQLAELVGKLPRCEDYSFQELCGLPATGYLQLYGGLRSYRCDHHRGTNHVDVSWANAVRALAAGGKEANEKTVT